MEILNHIVMFIGATVGVGVVSVAISTILMPILKMKDDIGMFYGVAWIIACIFASVFFNLIPLLR